MDGILKGGQPNDVAKEWLKANPDAATPWLQGVTTFDGNPMARKGQSVQQDHKA